MENFIEVQLGYSLKNVPIANQRDYKLQLIKRVEEFLGSVRWKFYWHSKQVEAARNQHQGNQQHGQQQEQQQQQQQQQLQQEPRNTYGFKTSTHPPRAEELKPFEN